MSGEPSREGMVPGLRSAARALLARDLRLLWRGRGGALQPALFALLVVVVFALALGGERGRLAGIAAAVLWAAVLLAGLLALDDLFRSDVEDGTLEQWRLSPVPLAWLVAVRTFSHWLTSAVPLLLAVPLLGAVVAALTAGLRRSGVLPALLAVPLYVPVLVFGAGSVAAAGQGLDPGGALLLLGAGLAVALVLAPLAAAAALRIALE